MKSRQTNRDDVRLIGQKPPELIDEDPSDITVDFASEFGEAEWPPVSDSPTDRDTKDGDSKDFEVGPTVQMDERRQRSSDSSDLPHSLGRRGVPVADSSERSLSDQRSTPAAASPRPADEQKPGRVPSRQTSISAGDAESSGSLGDSSSGFESMDEEQLANGMRLATAAECRVDLRVQSLRRRLAAVAFLLGGGLTTFLIWYVVSVQTSSIAAKPFGMNFLSSVLIAQLVVAIGLLLTGIWLVAGRTNELWKLHLVELFVFGLPAILFTLWQFEFITQFAQAHNVLPSATGAWVLLMFIYALFIPNSVGRAACYIGLFALLPSSLTIYMVYFHEGCCEAANASTSYVVQMLMQLALGGITASVGVSMIGGLRQEASKARELGQYVLLEKIGEGGMGEVYLGEHRLMKRPCAIKLIRPERAGNPRTLARFEREVSATARLSHWNNIDIYDYGRSRDGTFFYVMEYLPGLTVRELVALHGPIPQARAVHLLRQVCFALEEAHAHKLIHRDIKPSNIMVCNRGGVDDVAKLLDFGLAKPLLDSDSEHVTQDQAITGSPRFMSPEQATGEKRLEPASDVYSLGCVAYFMLAGRPPFEEKQVIRAIMAHATKIPTSLSDLDEGIDPELARVVAKCLEKNPQDRFQTTLELREALDACRIGSAWDDSDATKWWNARGTG